jgi:AraC family transcriptional regulator
MCFEYRLIARSDCDVRLASGKALYASILQTLQTPRGTLEPHFSALACRSAEASTFADVASPAKLILPEIEWRKRPVSKNARPDAGYRVTLSRWTVTKPVKPLEVEANYPDDSHLITFSLVPSSVEFFFAGKQVANGKIPMDTVLITGPGEPSRTIFTKIFDCVRIYMSQSFLAECFTEIYGHPPSGPIELFDPHFMADPLVFQLASLLAQVDDDGGPAGPTFVDGLSIALAARLFTLNSTRGGALVSNRSTPLPKWRLKRAVDYIEANLTKPIYLAELSNVAGLTRMHFAAQFRAATGSSPHNYILRRKVAFSQRLLLDSQLSIADVAAMMSFSSQAHFTVVFKRVVGKTPVRWRQASR